jgi:hypothetical protein
VKRLVIHTGRRDADGLLDPAFLRQPSRELHRQAFLVGISRVLLLLLFGLRAECQRLYDFGKIR